MKQLKILKCGSIYQKTKMNTEKSLMKGMVEIKIKNVRKGLKKEVVVKKRLLRKDFNLIF